MNKQLLPYLQLARFPAVFTAMSNILAAHLIVTSGHIEWLSLMLLIAASSCIYLSGMVLNDCFDLEEDREHRPDRPLPAGTVGEAVAWRLGGILMLAGVVLAACAGMNSLIIAALLAVAVVVYDALVKRNLVGAVVMALCRYLNWLLGLSIVALHTELAAWALPIFFYILAVTVLSQQETRAANRWVVCWVALAVLMALAGLLLLYSTGIASNGWALLFGLAGAGMIFGRLLMTFRSFTQENIQQMVKIMIFGVVPLDAILVLSAGLWWESLLILGLLIPARLLARRLYVT